MGVFLAREVKLTYGPLQGEKGEFSPKKGVDEAVRQLYFWQGTGFLDLFSERITCPARLPSAAGPGVGVGTSQGCEAAKL